MIPTTIEQLAATRPTSHGQVTDQEIRVGQMLLAQSVIALTKRIDTLLAAKEAPDPAPPRSGIEILKKAIERAERPAKVPKVRAPKPAPEPTPPPAPAPVEPPAPVEVRSNGVPVDLASRYRDAYLEGAGARLAGEPVESNPYTGDRGIAGGRRLAWVRGFNEGVRS